MSTFPWSFYARVPIPKCTRLQQVSVVNMQSRAPSSWFAPHSEKLNVSPDTVQHGVEGLMYLMTECAKFKVSPLPPFPSLGETETETETREIRDTRERD